MAWLFISPTVLILLAISIFPLIWSLGLSFTNYIATGNVGGGMWYGSSHSKNLDAVGQFLEYATSGPQSVELITGLPAYASTA